MAVWATNGVITNPTTGQVVADTGPLPATPISPVLLCWSSVGVGVTLHYRNAANTADLRTQRMALTTEGTPFQVINLPANITLNVNERLTLTVDAGFVGQIQCSILIT